MSEDIKGVNVLFTGDATPLKKAGEDADKAVADTAKGVTASVKKIKDASEKAFDSMTNRVRRMSDEISGSNATRKLYELSQVAKKLGDEGKLTDRVIVTLGNDIKKLTSQGGQIKSLGDAATSLNKISAAAAKLNGKVDLGGIFKGEAAEQAQQLAGNLGPLGGILGKIGPGAIAAGAGIGVAVLALKELADASRLAMDWAAKITDTATTLSTTTDQVQRLEHAARASGTEFAAVTQIVGKLNAELVNSPGKFEKLGLSVEQLRSMDPVEMFATVAKAIEAIPDKNEQAALSNELLGKSWQSLAPLIKGGLGAMKDAPIVAGETVKALNDTKTASNVLGGAWERLWVSIGAVAVGGKDAPSVLLNMAAAIDKVSSVIQTLDLRKMLALASLGSSEVLRGAVLGVTRGVDATFTGSTDAERESKSRLTEIEAQVHNENLRILAGTGGPQGPVGPQQQAARKNNEAETKALADAQKALDDARSKGLLPLERELATIDANTAAKKREVDANDAIVAGVKEQVKARLDDAAALEKGAAVWANFISIQSKAVSGMGDAAATRRAALEEALAAFGPVQSDLDFEFARIMGNVENIQHGFENMERGQLENFRAKVTDIAEASDTGLFSEDQWDALANAGDEVIAQLIEEGELVDAGGGKWMRKKVAAQEAADKERDGVKKVNEKLQEQVRLLLEAAQKSQQIGTIFGQLSGVAGSLGSKFGADVLGGAQGIFGAAGNLNALKAKKAAGEKVSGLEMFGGQLAVAAAGIQLGATLFQGIKSAFRSESDKIMDDVGKRWGVQISEGLAKSIEETVKKKGIHRTFAELLHLGDIIAESGKDPSEFADKIGDLLNATKLGAVETKDGIQELGEAFSELQKEAEGGSAASEAAMVGMIRRAKELQLSIPEIDAFVRSSLKVATDNLEAFFKGQGSEVLTAMRGGTETDTVTGKVSAAQAIANQEIFGAVFAANAALDGLVVTAEQTKKAFDEMVRSLPEGTQLTGIAAQAALVNEALKNPLFKGSAESAAAGGKILNSLRQTDNLSPAVVKAFETTLASGMDQARAGLEGIPNLTEDQQRRLAMEANLPMLVELQHARAAGVVLAPETEAILAKAQADGLLPALSIAEQQLDVQKRILGALGGSSGSSTQTGSSGTGTTTNTGAVNGPPPGFGNNGNTGYWGGGANYVPQYDQGTPWVPSDQLALLHRGEGVIPADYNAELLSPMAGGTTAAEAGVTASEWRASETEMVASLGRLEEHMERQAQSMADMPWVMRKVMRS